MLAYFRRLFRAFLTQNAMRSGRFVGLYRKFCQPHGAEWASYLKHHDVLYSMGEDCVVNMNVEITDPKHVRLGNNVRLTGCTLLATTVPSQC